MAVIRDIVATSCRDRREGGGESAQRDGGSPGRAEGGVGGRDSQWGWSVVASVDPGVRGQLCSGLADGQAVCLGVCSL